MRERIDKLSRGIVSWHRPGLKISQTNITLTIPEGENGQGNFQLESIGDSPVRGIIYSSSSRVELVQNQFDSNSFLVEYVFDGGGLESGDMEKSSFYIVSDGGEYEIPITVFVNKSEHSVVSGKVHSISDLTDLAKKQWEEAFRLFGSGAFYKLIKREAPVLEPLYRGLRARGLTEWDLEEFLIAAGEKEPIHLTLLNPEQEFKALDQSKKVTIRVSKNTWGYLPIRLEADAACVQLEKDSLNARDFIGNEAEITYVVHHSRIHGGNNYGRIRLITPYQQLEHKLTIHATRSGDSKAAGRTARRQYEADLLRIYLDFRLKRMNKSAWTKQSMAYLDKLRVLDEEHEGYPLFQVQMYLADGLLEEARWILEKYAKKRWGKGRNYEWYAYYLYLNSIYRKDANYTKRVRDEIRRLYTKEKKWQYAWILLYVDQGLTSSPERRLDIIRKQYEAGAGSLILYLEACLILSKDCTKLMRLDDFAVYILASGARRGAVSKELAERTAELARQEKGYRYLTYHMLECFYQMYPEPGILAAVCSILIRGNKTDAASFAWYEKGIARGIKITRIFEYYIYAMDDRKYRELPKNLLMYFAYETSLDDRRKALLYANIIQYAEQYPGLYGDFRKQIERFMIGQLKKRNMNRDLALIYRTFLTPGVMDEELAAALAEILFTWEIQTDQLSVKNVVVVHLDLDQEQIVPCVNGTACVRIYSEHYQMFFQDARGIRYIRTINCEKKPLLEPQFYDQICAAYECRHTGYLLHKWKRLPIQEDNIPVYIELYRNKYISAQTRQYIQKEVLMSYQLMQDQEWVGEFLPGLDFDVLSARERNAMMDILLEQGLFDRAYSLYKRYGMCQTGENRMVKMAGRMIREKGYALEEDLLHLSARLFQMDTYDKSILEYMTEYYNRDSRSMARLWEAAKDFDLDTHKLEERLLPQILFTGIHLDSAREVFASYNRGHANRRIRQAWLTDQAYRYFVHQSLMDPELPEYLESEYKKEHRLPEPCRMALLAYYAGEIPAEGARRKMLQTFLENFIYEGKVAACFLKYDRSMTESLFLTEQVIVEHRADPDARVVLYYRIVGNGRGGSFTGETMKQSFEGVYVKQIPLFYGEQLEYYIIEKTEQGENRTAETVLKNTFAEEVSDSRYGYLNRMYRAQQEQNDELLTELVRSYRKKDEQTETLFVIR